MPQSIEDLGNDGTWPPTAGLESDRQPAAAGTIRQLVGDGQEDPFASVTLDTSSARRGGSISPTAVVGALGGLFLILDAAVLHKVPIDRFVEGGFGAATTVISFVMGGMSRRGR